MKYLLSMLVVCSFVAACAHHPDWRHEPQEYESIYVKRLNHKTWAVRGHGYRIQTPRCKTSYREGWAHIDSMWYLVFAVDPAELRIKHDRCAITLLYPTPEPLSVPWHMSR